MPVTLQYQPPAYTLVEGLREPVQASSVSRGVPDEWAREELLLRKLGTKGWGRIYQFQKYYASGWGEKGKVLSPKALGAFFRFVEATSFPSGKASPSVFLTDGGGIELCWEDSNGRSLQVEFTGTGSEFYKAATEEEGEVSFDRLAELSRQLAT